jgi:polyisoprenoid-binding protein YceI
MTKLKNLYLYRCLNFKTCYEKEFGTCGTRFVLISYTFVPAPGIKLVSFSNAQMGIWTLDKAHTNVKFPVSHWSFLMRKAVLNHLKSANFFDAAKFRQMRFVSTSFVPSAEVGGLIEGKEVQITLNVDFKKS